MVTVEFFGVPRQRAGRAELTVSANTIAEVLAAVRARLPRIGRPATVGRRTRAALPAVDRRPAVCQRRGSGAAAWGAGAAAVGRRGRMKETGTGKRQVHPLVAILLGAAFGGLFGGWLVWELAPVPDRTAILWGGAIGAGVVVGLLGIGASRRWLYRRVPTIQQYTKTAYARGAAVGGGLGVMAGLAWPFMRHRAGSRCPTGTPRPSSWVVGGGRWFRCRVPGQRWACYPEAEAPAEGSAPGGRMRTTGRRTAFGAS